MADGRVQEVLEDDLVSASVIEAFVPARTDVNIKDEIEGWNGEGGEQNSSLLPFIEQRQFLLLDELVSVGVVLRTLKATDTQLKESVSRLKVKLEARVIGSPTPRQSDSSNPAQVSEVLQALHTKDLGIPEICRNRDEDDHRYTYIFWKTAMKLSRPKAKLQKIGVYFVVSASLDPPAPAPSQADEDDYLPSMEYLAPNVLQMFTNNPRHSKANLQLQSPGYFAQNSSEEVQYKPRSIKSGSRQLFRTAPALLWRLKFLTLPDSPRREETIVALDFEVTSFAEAAVKVFDVQLTPTIGKVEPLGVSLPMTCFPGNQATLIYKLVPDRNTLPRLSKDDVNQEINIVAQASVHISDSCRPHISIAWKTTVETPKARPLSGSRPILHASRPNTADQRASSDLVKTFDPDALTMTGRPGNVHSSATVASGVSLTVIGAERMEVGRPFEWTVLVANKSDKPQRLAIVTVPRRRGPSLPQPNDISGVTAPRSNKSEKPDTKNAAAQRHIGTEQRAGLVCLTPDIRIGPLAPSASHEAVVRFLPLDPGVAHLDAFRLVDLSNQSAIDVLNIPDIAVVRHEGLSI